ncbi:hypothetical protein [Mesotoga sp. Brook.08.YT.4.2.5.1]|uniref:hypothetical protein n=1 Tax=Mesotoga sp. Brook.08.YT.4.2.5.1 TaxID=1421001 RepID=UPI0015E064CB|nr:hypothetical protein [Mesotoga sp. Brook.08.YT.4.2.5.1]
MGVDSNGRIVGVTKLSDLGRDINGTYYGVAYTETTSGKFKAVVFTTDSVDEEEVIKVLKDATKTSFSASYNTADYLTGGKTDNTDMTVRYEFEFTVY